MTAYTPRNHKSATPQHGYLLFVEDRNDANVIGLFWAPIGKADALLSIYREQRPHAHLVQYASCTHHEYATLLHSFDRLCLGGIWHRRGGAIEALLAAIEEHDRAEMEKEMNATEQTPRRNRRRQETGYAESTAATY